MRVKGLEEILQANSNEKQQQTNMQKNKSRGSCTYIRQKAAFKLEMVKSDKEVIM